MSAHQCIQLQKLPYLAIKEVLLMMDPMEQIDLSRSSKRAFQLVKLVNSCSPIRSTHCLQIKITPYTTVTRISNLVATQCVYEEYRTSSRITFFIDLFQLNTVLLEFCNIPYTEIRQNLQYLKEVKNLNIQEITVNSRAAIDFRILEENRDVPRLKLNYLQGLLPAYNPKNPYNFELLTIENATWISANHALNLFWNCQKIVLKLCRLTMEEVVEFVRKWMLGGSRLKHVCLGYRGEWRPELLESLPAQTVDKLILRIGRSREVRYTDGCYYVEQTGGGQGLIRKGPNNTFNLDIMLGRPTKIQI